MLTLPPDHTFLIQIGIFALLFFVLGKTLFSPFLALLQERAERTTGDIANAAASREEVAALSARVDQDLAAARSAAQAEVERVRAETRAEAAKLFDQAQQEAGSRLAELRAEVRSATEEARRALGSDARAIADAMVGAVLGSGAGK